MENKHQKIIIICDNILKSVAIVSFTAMGQMKMDMIIAAEQVNL